MKLANVSIKRFMVGGITAAAMVLPFTLPSAALASRGSRDVRGNLPTRAQQLVGDQGMKHQSASANQQFQEHQYSAEPSQDHQYTVLPINHPDVAEQAINPTLNPTKPMNIN
jgi:hypothetical protein